MSEILSELLSFKGDEVYIEEIPGAVGHSLYDVNLRLPHSTVIGVVRNDEPILNPDADKLVEEGDKLILISGDDNVSVLQERAAVNNALFQLEPDEKEESDTLLVIGYSDLLKQILLEEDVYSTPGSKVIIAVEPGRVDEEDLPESSQFKNIKLELRECKIYSRRALEKLVAEGPSSILLIADTELADEEADARTLMLQLQLTDIAESIGAEIPLTIEMNSTRNQKLSQMMRATDFVVSSRITAKMMAQISEERHKKNILNDLISEGGSSICMKPISRYVVPGEAVDFYTLGASASRYNEIAIGHKRFAEDGTFSIEINPKSREATLFTDKDELIVIAKNAA